MSAHESWRDAAMATHYATHSAASIVEAANSAAGALLALAHDRPDLLAAVEPRVLLAASLLLSSASGALHKALAEVQQ